MSKIVRTPARAEGGITAEEKERMSEISKKWIDIAMRTDPIERDKIEPAIHALYEAAGLKRPRVVIVPSPLVMAFAYGASAWIWHCRKQDKKVAATSDATRAATRAATVAATVDATYAANLDSRSPEEQAAQACRELAGQGGILCAARWWPNYQGGNMWAAWASFLQAARDVLGLRLPQHEKYQAWEDCAMHGGFRVMHEKFCIVSDFPAEIHKDEQNRPHNENGPSHLWRDGWGLYHWRGVKVPKEWITEKSLSAAQAINWPNLEQRRAACEIIGWAKVLDELDAKVIDTDDDEEIGVLLEAEIPDSGPERFLKVRCGTGRVFVLAVPRECNTALDASAWTYGLENDVRNYLPEVRT